MQLWPDFARLREHKRKHWPFVCLRVSRESEPRGKQRAHHEAHLIFCGICPCFGLDVEPFLFCPLRQLRVQCVALISGKAVCETDVSGNGHVHCGEKATICRIAVPGTQREIRIRTTILILFYRGDLERHFPPARLRCLRAAERHYDECRAKCSTSAYEQHDAAARNSCR